MRLDPDLVDLRREAGCLIFLVMRLGEQPLKLTASSSTLTKTGLTAMSLLSTTLLARTILA